MSHILISFEVDATDACFRTEQVEMNQPDEHRDMNAGSSDGHALSITLLYD